MLFIAGIDKCRLKYKEYVLCYRANVWVPPNGPALLENVSAVVNPVRQIWVQKVLQCVSLVERVGVESHVSWYQGNCGFNYVKIFFSI